MKHYEVNFTDGTMETIAAEDLPPQIISPMFAVQTGKGQVEFQSVPEHRWWYVTYLRLDPDSTKFVSYGMVHINLDTVTFIKEV